MVTGEFVLSAYRPKDEVQKRKIKFRETRVRYFVVFLAIMVVFFEEYCFDNPSALQQEIQHNYQLENHQEIGEAFFNLLYSIYSLPNIIVPIIGGILIDKIGARVVFLITLVFVMIGQLIFSWGGISNVFTIMLIGRLIFGFGGEVIVGAQNTLISNWFKASQLPLVLGICVSFPKLGSSLNAFLSPTIAHLQDTQQQGKQYDNVGIPAIAGLLGLVVGLILVLILFYLDRKSEKDELILHQSALLSSETGKSQLSSVIKSRGKPSEVVLVESTFVKELPSDSQLSDTGDHISLSAIKKLPATYWLLIIISTLAEALFIPFLDNANKYYTSVFKGLDQPQDAGLYLIIPYLLAAILTPVIGILSQKISSKSYLIITSSSCFFFTYAFMFFMQTSPSLREWTFVRWIPVAMLGLSISTFATIIIPAIPMVVSPKLLGTAFGLMEVLQNIILTTFPLITGQLRQSKQESFSPDLAGFHFQTQFLFLVGAVMIGCSFLLKSIDLVTGCKLDVKDFRKQYIKKVLGQD